MSQRARRTTAVSSVALGVVALVAAGTVAGLVLAPERTPASVTRTPGPMVVDVTTESFDDTRQVAVTAEQTTGSPLSVRDQGLVTRTACEPGASITSGTSPVTVDDRPVLALATSEPLWRDLTAGTRGSDVTALQTELARLGHDVRVDGRYGGETTAAVRALQRAAGASNPTGNLSAVSVMWLPAPEVVVGDCAVDLAGQVGEEPFATTAGALTSLTLAEDVSAAVPGERVLRSQGVSAPVDAEGRVTDPGFLTTFASSPEWAFAQSEQGAEQTAAAQVKVEYALASPVDALVVPPAALYALTGDAGCVLGEAGPTAVRVVASTLGKALVVTEGTPPTRVEVAPDDPPPCG